MYKSNIKDLASRGTSLAAAVGLLTVMGISAVFPTLASADALNPLTERTLLLSSSSPGMHYTDGAGNTAYGQGAASYAAPGTGPNGKQTGESFSFKVSTNSTGTTDANGKLGTSKDIKAFTFQYCTTAAGTCTAPGNNVGNGVGSVDTTTTSDLNVHYPTPAEVTTPPASQADGSSLVARNDSQGNFGVYVGGTLTSGWSLTAANHEEDSTAPTGKNNFITLVHDDEDAGGLISPISGTEIKIVFYATDDNYITNPGAGAFFVKINNYDSADSAEHVPATEDHIIDGGVTVANVMTDSIQISTKVLETMSFSVGTENPDTVDANTAHGPCDIISVNDPLKLGDEAAEFSLQVNQAHEVTSYWRLSSNSSNGASVYYSGYTLSNTVGDQIDPVWSATDTDGDANNGITTRNLVSHPGMEQFGLALMTAPEGVDSTNGTPGPGNDLGPLVAEPNYANGDGTINGTDMTAKFAFDVGSNTTPALLATENQEVVDCSTGKMRYIGNIAGSTPAGIYSTKVNYLAAPQY